MTTYYKSVRPDGTDFQTGTVRWLPPVGETLPDELPVHRAAAEPVEQQHRVGAADVASRLPVRGVHPRPSARAVPEFQGATLHHP